jgi:thiamine-phosphate pyrophosphorylase
MASQLSALYPILDAPFLPKGRSLRAAFLEQTAHSLHEAGVTLLQLREKRASADLVRADAAVLRQAAPARLRLILNDDPTLARELGFDGVHLGRQDMPIAEARRLLAPGRIIGLSTHLAAQVIEADATTADYIAIGPVFATTTKADAEPVVGLEGVREARALTNKPLVAIGGITLANAASVREAGADAVAVISALFGDPERSPAKIAEDFLRRMR